MGRSCFPNTNESTILKVALFGDYGDWPPNHVYRDRLIVGVEGRLELPILDSVHVIHVKAVPQRFDYIDLSGAAFCSHDEIRENKFSADPSAQEFGEVNVWGPDAARLETPIAFWECHTPASSLVNPILWAKGIERYAQMGYHIWG